MVAVGVLARFEVASGNEEKMERFFQEGLTIVQQQKASTLWFAFRLSPTTFGAFAAFANEEDRQVLLSKGGPKASQSNANLFTSPPIFQKIDILAAKFPGREESVPVGSLVRFATRPGKEAQFEQFLKQAQLAIQEVSGTPAWFAIRLEPSIFGVFDAFSGDEERLAHFLAGAERAERASELLETPPVVEKLNILAARLPG